MFEGALDSLQAPHLGLGSTLLIGSVFVSFKAFHHPLAPPLIDGCGQEFILSATSSPTTQTATHHVSMTTQQRSAVLSPENGHKVAFHGAWCTLPKTTARQCVHHLPPHYPFPPAISSIMYLSLD